MTEALLVGVLALSAAAATVAVIAAVLAVRYTSIVARRLHEAIRRLDTVVAAIPDADHPRDLDALRAEVEWLTDTLTNELVQRDEQGWTRQTP